MRFNIKLPTGLNDGSRDRVMATTGAQGRDRAFVIAARVTDLVGGQFGMVHPRFGDVGHAASLCREVIGAPIGAAFKFLPMEWVMKRAVMGAVSYTHLT